MPLSLANFPASSRNQRRIRLMGGGGPTGDFKWRPTSEVIDGWVRANGLTIGSTASIATERADDDTLNLYTYLYNNLSDAICTVSGGRGADAPTDFAANKTLKLIDLRGRALFGLDDMGNSAASRLTGATFTTGNAITAASVGGEAAHALSTAELAAHTHTTPAHTHSIPIATIGAKTVQSGGGDNVDFGQTAGVTGSDGAGTTGSSGSGTAHNTMSPFMLGTWFIRL